MSVVLVTGAFDIIHVGHLEMIEYAESLCTKDDWLIVAIDSDEKIRKEKGIDRPFNNQKDREYFLNQIKNIDDVTIFETEEQLIELCKTRKPRIRVVGSDWKDKKIIGAEHCGKIEFFERIPGYSTTNILKGIKK